jgi:hypothetical protein
MKQPLNENDAALVDAWLDGQLRPDEARALAGRLPTDGDLREEEARLRRLFAAIELSRVPVREGFADRVMASLPRRAGARGFALALGLAAALAALAASVALVPAELLGVPAAGSLAAALGDYFATLVLAGAGLLGASWRGVGDGVRSFFALSPANAAIVVGVAAASALLLVALLRRRATATARARRRRD